MQTLNDLRATLGIGSLNQIRNRIDAIREPLRPYMKRGPNNQILIEDEGVRLLVLLQELHDTGLTIREASKIVETKAQENKQEADRELYRLVQNSTKHGETAGAGGRGRPKGKVPQEAVGETSRSEREPELEAVRFELASLRERVIRLEGLIGTQQTSHERGRWWESVEEG